MGGERRESNRDTSGAEWLRRASRLTRKFACGLRRRVPHAGNRDVGRIASGSRAAGVLRRQGSRRSRQFACLDIAPCKVWWEAMQANSQVCLLRYNAMHDAQVGWEAKQAHSAGCLRWYCAMPEVWLWEGKQANSQVCLLWYSAMLDAMVGREAKCMFACFGIAGCKTLWFGGKQSRQTRKFACFGRARCETLRLGGNQSLPWYSTRQDAMVGREQSRPTRKFACYGITRRKTLWLGGSKAGKLASLPALV